jgi:rhodanese-related sulfurtransferase
MTLFSSIKISLFLFLLCGLSPILLSAQEGNALVVNSDEWQVLKSRFQKTLGKKLYQQTRKYTVYPNQIFEPSSQDSSLFQAFADTSQYLFVDVRTFKEQAVSIIPRAISQETFWENFKEYFPPNNSSQTLSKKIIAYCTIGYRSAKFVRKLRKQNIPAYNLAAGVLGWSHFTGPLIHPKNQKPTRQVHVYTEGWNFLNPTYEAIW